MNARERAYHKKYRRDHHKETLAADTDIAEWRNVVDVLTKHEPTVAGGELVSIRLDNGKVMTKDGDGRLVVGHELPTPRRYYALPLLVGLAMLSLSVWAWFSGGFREIGILGLFTQDPLLLTVLGLVLIPLVAIFCVRVADAHRLPFDITFVKVYSFIISGVWGLVILHDAAVVLGVL